MAKKKVTVEFTNVQWDALELMALDLDQTVEELIQQSTNNYAQGAISAIISRVDESDTASIIKNKLAAKKKEKEQKAEE